MRSGALYTNLNFTGTSTVSGKITGENKVLNTVKLNNDAGTIHFNGDEINVNTIDNTGTININKSTDLAVANGNITGSGSLVVKSNGGLALNKNVQNIANTVDLENNSFLSTLNNSTSETKINKLNTKNN